MKKYDFLIVGAGISGLVIAERLCTQLGKTCLIVEKRNHIGGNCYDYYDDAGVLIHKYGPHYFRTNSQRIVEYLSDFTKWHEVEYKIKSWTDGRFWNFPINLNTFEQIIGRSSSSEEMVTWLESKRLPVEKPKNSEEVILDQVGHELYEKFFLGYTKKQWKCHPRDLDASVCGRIPIRTNRDDRYLKERFQALPKDGYTAMFGRMIDNCGDLLQIRLQSDYRELTGLDWGHMIYTGPIDAFYEFRFGKLPYRSLRFEHESFSKNELKNYENISGKAGFYQPAMQVNYPNEYDYTRIVEVKHATGQICENSTIVKEYPEDFGPGKEPYYPVPNSTSKELYHKYKALADKESHVSFAGRLATYKYYNMDQVVGMALSEFEKQSSRVN